MHKIAVVSLTLREMAALDAAACFVLRELGPKLKVQGPDCYEALTDAKSKLEKLAAHETAKMSV